MKTAILVHGMPSEAEYIHSGRQAANKHWFPWIQAQLESAGVEVYMPEMPEPYEPVYEKWTAVFEQFKIDADTMLVGHSLGGGFLVRWLSEHKTKVGKVVLVAPWLDPNHELKTGMFDFEIDKNLAEKTAGTTEFISLDDDQEELTTLKILKDKITGLQVREFTDKGHFVFEDMKTKEFPELLNFLIQ